MVVLVAVVPEFGLVEQEEEHQPHQQSREQWLGAGLAFERLGQQVHERRRHQGAGGQAQEVLGIDPAAAASRFRLHADAHEAGGEPDAADAGGQGRDQDCDQCHLDRS